MDDMEDSIKTTLKKLKANESTVSMLLGSLVVLVVIALLFNYFNTETITQPQITQQAVTSVAEDVALETVQEDALQVEIPRVDDVAQPTRADKPPTVQPDKYEVAELVNPALQASEVATITSEQLATSAGTEVKTDSGFIGGIVNRMQDWFGGESDVSAPSELSVTQAEKDEEDQLPTNHTVAAGEHLWAIAERYYDSGYNWVDIAETNGLGEGNEIEIGQELSIPDVPTRSAADTGRNRESRLQTVTVTASISGDTYMVAAGDTLWQIAEKSYGDGLQWPKIYDANSNILVNPNIIETGQQLTIPKSENVL